METDLFGNPIDEFVSALERYGVWPTTVWEVDHQDKTTREIKEAIGDIGRDRESVAWRRNRGIIVQTREGAFTKPTQDESVYRGKVSASIFSPAVSAWLLNCFAPTGCHVFDPFAGGGTRAIMTAKSGRTYHGIELRAEEVEAVQDRVLACGIESGVEIQRGDARNCDNVKSRSADFLITCPPYWNLEQYNGGPEDLSMISTYPAFLGELGRVIGQTKRILRPGALSCWVVGLHRMESGELAPLHHGVARLHQEAGFTMREEIILSQKGNGAVQRIGNFEKGDRRLIRTHEYALVFRA